ncbi:DUF5946 family protein [candidate division KSB1 bacterium]
MCYVNNHDVYVLLAVSLPVVKDIQEERYIVTELRCPECGAVIPEDKESCRDMFDEILAREFSDPGYGQVLRLTLDAYALQHPGSYMNSFSSHAAHLTGLCIAFEYNGGLERENLLKKWYDRKPNFLKVSKPSDLGKLTIADILDADTPEEHSARVREWAQDAWNAWSEHHDTVRFWIKEAIGE